ncbi:T-cell immunoreceptor with Ig and ITIM domains-like isoform X1 [Anguilla rostrata]|uniref:T-cell immunoreceptor with Ig and ITIM domains-like isoform X1 n=2 Tax=Anguilla rostrata TaxID=7938 RepID=UPI0030CF68ED
MLTSQRRSSMRVIWPDQALLFQNRIQNIILLLGLLFITGSLATRVTTPRNMTALTGNPVTLTCDLDGDGKVFQVEWNRCDGRKVLVFHRDHGKSVNTGYRERISVVTLNRFTLLETRANDSGEYCCELSTFPHGTLKGKLTLLLQTDMSQVSSSSSLIVSIVSGILGFAVLGVLFALLVSCQGRRRRVRHPVHVAVHSRGLPQSHQSFLKTSPLNIRREGQEENDVEEEEKADYFNVLTSKIVNNSSNSP